MNNTYKDKVLDIIITNRPRHYSPPVIFPPVPCDDPSSGKPSDHSQVVASPLPQSDTTNARVYYTRDIRPINDEASRQLSLIFLNQDYSWMEDIADSSTLVVSFETWMADQLNTIKKMRFNS